MGLAVEIAGLSLDLQCGHRGFADFLTGELKGFRGGAGDDATIRLSLEFAADGTSGMGDNSSLMLIDHPRGPDILLGIDSDGKELDIRASVAESTRGAIPALPELYSFLLTQVLTLTLQYLELTGRAHVLLIHACGAMVNDKGFIFAGASGSGKSTVAGYLQRLPSVILMGDELIAITGLGEGERLMMHSFPVASELPRNRLTNQSAPVGAVFFLSKADRTAFELIDSQWAAAELISTIIPPVPSGVTRVSLDGIDGAPVKDSMELLMDEAIRLAAASPYYHLSLALDDQPWERIFAEEFLKGGTGAYERSDR